MYAKRIKLKKKSSAADRNNLNDPNWVCKDNCDVGECYERRHVMMITEAKNKFFEDTIVVQFGKGAQSKKTRDWIDRQIGNISGVKIEFVELDELFPLGVKLFHNGDVITGRRLGYFLSYVQKLGSL